MAFVFHFSYSDGKENMFCEEQSGSKDRGHISFSLDLQNCRLPGASSNHRWNGKLGSTSLEFIKLEQMKESLLRAQPREECCPAPALRAQMLGMKVGLVFLH